MLENVCVPVNLDAFVLNVPVCDSGACRIAPITQPDYVSLRLENSVLQHDILPPIDVHNTQPATANLRISGAYSNPLKTLDLKNPNPSPSEAAGTIESRVGVYLHWSLPRGYRSGSSAASGTTENQPDGSKKDTASPSPVFQKVPNRWLIVRVLHKHLPDNANIPTLDAWVVNSDELRVIEELGDDVDIQTEVSPFVSYDGNPSADNVLRGQAEKYIGRKTPLKDWSEQNRPSVPLTVFSSANPLFPDYTLHCPNVFSIKDNFEYGTKQYLTYAECDYLAIGWHSSTGDGPLGAKGGKGDLNSRLSAFLCSLNDDTPDSTKNSRDKTSVLMHGGIYGVIFDRGNKPKGEVEKYAANFTDKVDMEPISIGTTPLDSVLTFLAAHTNDDDAAEEELLGPGAASTTEKILSLSELLYATEDDYDSRIKASDLIFSQNFKKLPGGFQWHYGKRKEGNGPPPVPSDQRPKNNPQELSEVEYLYRLNELQELVDIAERVKRTKQWELFAQFFTFCSDPHSDNRLIGYRDEIRKLYLTATMPGAAGLSPGNGALQILEQLIQKAQGEIDRILDTANEGKDPLVQAKKIANEPFYVRTDPTLTIAGLDSGWPAEYLKSVLVRFHSDIKASTDASITNLLSKFQLPPASGDITKTIVALLNEAIQGKDNKGPGFKQWKGQPFCPIFIEWEAVFYNVDFEDDSWAVELQSSPLTKNNIKRVRYVNPKPLFDIQDPSKDPKNDTRVISGRFLVLPQPTFALAAVVNQVLSTAGLDLKADKDGKKLTDKDIREQLVNDVAKLKFISGDLSGFTDFLLTLGTGTHVKPNVKLMGVEEMEPLAEAYSKQVGGKIDMEKIHFQKMAEQTSKTPFAFLEDFSSTTVQPFKGVQHGQLAITKLKIVDKFGQVICTPAPERAPRKAPAKPKFIYPCLSDQLCPSLLPDPKDPQKLILNTIYGAPGPTAAAGNTTSVTQPSDPKDFKGLVNPFIQITPAINQPSRFNAYFLERDTSQNWKVCTDWENPIFGWIIVNYADSALQFFTGDGVFYTSIRFGGPNGTLEAPRWAPFAQPAPDKTNVVSQQLVDLVNRMVGAPGDPKTQAYLNAMWDMIEKAIVTMPFPPSQYSGFANAIVGKPLALVNVGVSLELAEPVMKARYATQLKKQPDKTEEQVMGSYKFPVKVGDLDRPFDGVVCYWDVNESTKTTKYDTIYTYFPEHDTDKDVDVNTAERIKIETSNFPILTPYHPDPVPFKDKVDPGLRTDQISRLLVKTLLVDPYTPIHFYSGILPIKSIQVPEWSLQLGLKKMTAFFTVGPILVTRDVPKSYDAKNPVEADTWLKNQAASPAPVPEASRIKLPIAGGKGMWNWLQPYPNPASSGTASGDDAPPPLYNSFEVGAEDGLLRDDPAPYTLLEGFLQLARPLTQEVATAPS